MEFSGRLQAFPMTELLGWAANDRRTGSLLLRQPDREVRIFFRSGGIVACQTDRAEEFFGQYLLLEGLIEEETLVEILTECQETGNRLGRALLARGEADEATLVQALRGQISDLVLGTFLWEKGVFAFRTELPPKELTLGDGLDAMALAFEGARWIDEERRMREWRPSDRTRVGPGKSWPGENLSARQMRISEGLKARPAIDELYPRVRGSRFRFLEALEGLVRLDVAKVVHRAEADPSSRIENTLYELLLEQASEEQRHDLETSVRFPVAVLERLVPAWIVPPTDDDLRRLPVRMRTFLERLDGSARLGEVLSDDESARREEMELILLELQEEKLALLPKPIPEQGAAERSWWRRILGR